jgi:AcrR family transcriptional regulator
MLATLEGAGSSEYFRAGIHLPTLADRICQSMLHVGIGVYHEMPGAARVPATKIRLLLNGVAAAPSTEASGHRRSAAWRAAEDMVGSWAEADADGRAGRAALIHSVARAEFARRGFDSTTVRDIAAAAGVSTGAVYRIVQSKEELLLSIMIGYLENVERGWKSIARAESSVVDKLAALLWFNINIIETFGEEHRIQATWLRDSPPTSPNLPMTFPSQLRQLRTLLSAGVRAGELTADPVGLDLRARCLLSVIWTPENIVAGLGVESAYEFAAGTVLRGAALAQQHVA